jgi:hypothetical protein
LVSNETRFPNWRAVLERSVYESPLKQVNGDFTGSEEEQTKKGILISLHQFIEITNGNSIRAETKYSSRYLQCFPRTLAAPLTNDDQERAHTRTL